MDIIDRILYHGKKRLYIIFFCLVLLLSGCFESDSAEDAGGTYTVDRVIDGDTIEITGEKRVRLIGIDAPEVMIRVGDKWKFNPEIFGLEAKNYLREYLADKNISIEFDAVKEDRYGRWLGYVYDENGEFVNLDLIKKGYAVMQTFPPNTRHYSEFLKAQKKAMAEKVGLWITVKAIYPEQAYKFIGHFCNIKGEISSSRIEGSKVVLEFKSAGSNNVDAVIFARNLTLFEKIGIKSTGDYVGKYVQVTGKVRKWDRPVIVLDNPSQIKVLIK